MTERQSGLRGWIEYRRRRVRDQIERDRESRIPTWALAVLLVAVVAAWAGFVVVFG